jgi:hypothetical protein
MRKQNGQVRQMWVTSIAQNAFDPVSQKVSCPRMLLGYAQTADSRLAPFSGPRLTGVRQALGDVHLDEPDVCPVQSGFEATTT